MSAPSLTRRQLLGLGGGTLLLGAAGGGLLSVLRRDSGELSWHGRRLRALGTQVTLALRHHDPRQARLALRRAAGQILATHDSMTRFDPSPLRALNQAAAGLWRPLPGAVLEVLAAAQRINRESQGLFDVTVGGLGDLLRAHAGQAPTRRELALALDGIGNDKLQLDMSSGRARLDHPHSAVDLGGIATGHAVDRAAKAMQDLDIKHFIVSAGGDIRVAGDADAHERGWPIRVEAADPDAAPLRTLMLRDQAIATSGTTRVAEPSASAIHLLDPLQGKRAEALLSATVVADSALLADAWSTALFVGGRERASQLMQSAGLTRGLLLTREAHLIELS